MIKSNTGDILPMDAVIMAGGKGVRLRPLTYKAPKPMLEIGDKPMIAYNIEKLIASGIQNIYISVNYLKKQIIDYVNDKYGEYNIKFIEEEKPLGTLGSIKLVNDWEHEDILVLNADILSSLDFFSFYESHKKSEAKMSLAASNVKFKLPYGVLSSLGKDEYKFEEKPTIEYCATAGIYLIKKELIKYIPDNIKYDATELILYSIENKIKLNKFLIDGAWIDVGSKQTYEIAQEMVKKFK